MIKKFFLYLCLFCVFGIGLNASADCTFYAKSSSLLPVENALISLYNLSDGSLISANYTDASGAVSRVGGCDGVNVSISYAVSGYSAAVSNFSLSSSVPINDYVVASLNLRNTLGEFLEGQDAKVSAYLINADGSFSLVMDYPTQCKQKPEIVCDGSICNYAALSDCPFTDSQGWYYFRGPVKESDGFKYGKNYQLRIVINSVVVSGNFSTSLGRQVDVKQAEDWLTYNGGYLILGFGFLILLVVVFALCIVVYSFMRKSARSH